MKRTAMKRSGRLRSVSRRNGELSKNAPADLDRPAQIALVAALTEEAGWKCENPICRRRAKLDPHHVIKRSQGGLWGRDNIVMLCRSCHEWTDEAADDRRGRLVVSFEGGVRATGLEPSEMFEFYEFHQARYGELQGPAVPWRQTYVRGGRA